MTSFTRELMTAPNAVPITTATARSIMFPLNANALNSCHNFEKPMAPPVEIPSNRANLREIAGQLQESAGLAPHKISGGWSDNLDREILGVHALVRERCQGLL